MPNTILPKRKSTAGSVPAAGNLQSGELAVNTADGRLYTKTHNGVVVNLPAQSIAGQIVPGSVQFGAIGADSIKIDPGGGGVGNYRTITLQPNTLGASRTIKLPDANCDLACTYNGNTISSGLTVNQKLNSLRNNLGDPTAEEMALFHGQFSNKFRFLPPTLQEESADGTTWVASARMSASALGDLMIGEGQGTAVNVIPSAAVGTYGGYRLTWDVVAQTGYVFLNFLYIYSCACGNNIACKIEKYNIASDTWSEVHSGIISNYPGHTSIKHSTIAYHPSTTASTTFSKVRITFESTQNANTNAFTLNSIEWFGGYPGGQRRNAEFYDRDKNVTFPATIRVTGTGSDSACALSRSTSPTAGINFVDANTLDFVTNGGKRMRVATSGVGIGTGTTSPLSPLHIIGTTGASGFSPITIATNSLNSSVTHISTPNNSTYPFLAATNGGLVGANYGWGFFDSSTTGNLEIKRRNGSTTWVDAFSIARATGATVVNGGLSTIGQFGVGAVCRSNLSCDLGTTAGLAWSNEAFIGIQYINTDQYRLGLMANTGLRQTKIIAKVADNSGNIGFFPGNGLSEAARIHSNGYLGIGNTAPASRLEVTHTVTSNTSHAIAQFGAAGTGNWATSAHQVVIGGPNIAGYTGLVIYSDTTSGEGSLQFADGRGASDSWRGYVNYNHADNSLRFGTDATEKVRVLSSGNVGIGTTTPAEALEVNGSIKIANCTTRISRADGNSVKFAAHSSALGHYGIFIDNTATTNGRMFRLASWADGTTGSFVIRDDTVGVDRFIINSSGVASIGSGTLQLYDNSTSSWKSITANGNDLNFNAVHGIFGYSIGLRGSRGSACGLESNATNGYLAIAAGGGEKIRVSTAGNVGIGTTSPQAGFLLDVNGSSVIRGSVQASGDIIEFANSRFKLNGGAGSAAHSYASVGNGNFGINNTAPDAKLTVKGSGSSSLTKSLIVENSAGTDILTVRDDGRVGINQASPTHTLTVNGSVQASGNIGGSSLSGSTVTADFVYTNEIYVGGNSDGYFALVDGNADTIFELSPFGLWTTKPIEFAPATSANPGAVGHVVFERVSNTSLKIKMRGTDNVVRSATLTLS